jgi:hypothetical protein
MARASCTAYTELGCPAPPDVEVLCETLPEEELFPPRPGTSWEAPMPATPGARLGVRPPLPADGGDARDGHPHAEPVAARHRFRPPGDALRGGWPNSLRGCAACDPAPPLFSGLLD